MKLAISYYTDPVLRKKAERVEHIDDALRQFVADMLETMHDKRGIGLAAPQVGRSIALFITYVPMKKQDGRKMPPQERIFINPEVLQVSEETQTFSEGCLSIPNLYINVTRPSSIKIKTTNLQGETFEETLSGFEATNFLHEYDHLQGILITDRLKDSERNILINLLSHPVATS